MANMAKGMNVHFGAEVFFSNLANKLDVRKRNFGRKFDEGLPVRGSEGWRLY